jgi:hypothetical protein
VAEEAIVGGAVQFLNHSFLVKELVLYTVENKKGSGYWGIGG